MPFGDRFAIRVRAPIAAQHKESEINCGVMGSSSSVAVGMPKSRTSPKIRGRSQAFGNIAGSIELGVHDQALPSHGGTGLFEINPHYQKKAVLQFGGKLGKAFGILIFQVMNGARSDHEANACPLRE